jgi:hypothetical protein
VVDVFPPKTHALAGAVFNVVAQLGTSIGLALMAAVSSTYTKSTRDAGEGGPEALLYGYRAVFWACFGLMCLSSLMAPFGLRSVSTLGMA